MNDLEALVAADTELLRCLGKVTDADWQRPTPCTEWDVRALVNHVVGGSRRHLMLLHGATAAEVDATRVEDHLGEDPVGAYQVGARELAAAFQAPGAMDLVVQHPVGARTGRELLAMRLVDVTVHSWDLARGLGTHPLLDAALLQHALLTATGRRSDWPACPSLGVPGGLA